jgi:hypothetical protein
VEALVVGSASTATAKCNAWYYSASTSKVYWTSSATAITAPSAAQLATWFLLSTGVSPISGTTIFTLSGTTGLSIAFKEDAGSDAAVPFQSTVTSITGLTGSVACY